MLIKGFEPFLSTPSARRATLAAHLLNLGRQNFYPRPPRGGRLKGQKKVVGRYLFLSTPSARRATQKGCTGWDSQVISIHALREEGDPPQRRGITARRNFYPRPPRGGRPRLSGVPLRTLEISIHALREEGDRGSLAFRCGRSRFLSTPSARRATRQKG